MRVKFVRVYQLSSEHRLKGSNTLMYTLLKDKINWFRPYNLVEKQYFKLHTINEMEKEKRSNSSDYYFRD